MYYLLAGISFVLFAFVVFVMTRPAAFRIARSRVFRASPAELVAMIDDFHHWSSWSPWERLDPAMNRTFQGPTRGTGAGYRWKGNKKVGEGAMTIVDATSSSVAIDLEFIAPFPAKNRTTFTTERTAEGTRLTWAMEGRNESFMSKAFGALVNMDKMVGRDFENGLANLEDALSAASPSQREQRAA